MVTLGVPTLNRYDLLELMIASAESGTIKPDKYIIIDNGGKLVMKDVFTSLGDRLEIVRPGNNLGVAGSWNELSRRAKDIRVICNDDVKFFEDTLETLVNSFTEDAVIYPAGIPSANAFSCYILPDAVIERIGGFDETISPNYAYFEDNDYHRRMILAGIPLTGIPNCRLDHSPSSTLNNLSADESRKHHVRFKLAQKMYIRKWGGEPYHEKFTTPFGK